MGILLKNGYTLSKTGHEQIEDILIEQNQISSIGPNIAEGNHQVIDCQGKWVFPGFVDLHIHLREPGFEAKETIETGTKAAAKGGFTSVACMPNTNPPLDHADLIRWIIERSEQTGYARVLPIGAITEKQKGQSLNNYEAMKEAGIVAVSDDGVGVQSSYMMKQAMIKAKQAGLPVVAHCEDDTLIQGGALHEGAVAKKFGIPGIPSECESIHIGRDILLSEATGAHYHVCHVSTKESVRLVRDAKKIGIRVTAEVTPHHLLLCEDDIPSVDTNYKMNPPLRAAEDRDALIEGLMDGTIDIIATDHAPHTVEDKAQDMVASPFGIVGLETAFPLMYTHFVQKNKMSLKQLVDFLTIKPAELFGLRSGRLAEGELADVTIVDLNEEQAILPEHFASKGKNTPFTDWSCKGWPTMTIVDGQIVWSKSTGFNKGVKA